MQDCLDIENSKSILQIDNVSKKHLFTISGFLVYVFFVWGVFFLPCLFILEALKEIDLGGEAENFVLIF